MSDLIDRNKLIQLINDSADYEGLLGETVSEIKKIFAKYIEAVPTEKEIITCKDCKHFNGGDCTEMCKLVGDDDYCSFGEKEE